MSIITRVFPRTILQRQQALHLAQLKHSTLPPGSEVLRPQTVARLLAARAAYDAAIQQVGSARAEAAANTRQKEEAIAQCRMFVSHCIQVFNLGVARGKHPAAHRAFFKLDVEGDALPALRTDSAVLLWAQNIVSGDAPRLAAGGAPLTDPATAEVQSALTVAQALFTQHSTLADALDAAQESLAALNVETNRVIRRVWDEVEAFYGAESKDSMRANVREWGVTYVQQPAPATLTARVRTAAGVPLHAATARIAKKRGTVKTNADGRFRIATATTGALSLLIAYPGYAPRTVQAHITKQQLGAEIELGEVVLEANGEVLDG